MDVGRKALAFAVIGVIAAAFPVSVAQAGTVGTCALPTGCIELDSPDEVADAADKVSEGAGKVVDDVKKATDKTTPTERVTDPVVERVNKALDLTPGEADPASRNNKKHKKNRGSVDPASEARGASDGETAVAAAHHHAFDMRIAGEVRRNLDHGVDQAASFLSPTEPDLADRLAQAALDAAKAFTFPAILIGLIVGFILVQNRIDRRDPKLAYAPVSSDQDFLSFS